MGLQAIVNLIITFIIFWELLSTSATKIWTPGARTLRPKQFESDDANIEQSPSDYTTFFDKSNQK